MLATRLRSGGPAGERGACAHGDGPGHLIRGASCDLAGRLPLDVVGVALESESIEGLEHPARDRLRHRASASRAARAGPSRAAAGVSVARRISGLLAAAALSACATGPAVPTPAWRVTEADAGRTLRVPIGTEIDVTLPGSPSSGLVWERSPGDPGGLEAVGEATFEPAGPSPGQGGLVHLRFLVTKPGASVLWLASRRPFESGAPAAGTFSVTVVGEVE